MSRHLRLITPCRHESNRRTAPLLPLPLSLNPPTLLGVLPTLRPPPLRLALRNIFFFTTVRPRIARAGSSVCIWKRAFEPIRCIRERSRHDNTRRKGLIERVGMSYVMAESLVAWAVRAAVQRRCGDAII